MLRAYQNAVGRRGGALRGPCRQVHGRRRARLLRLAQGARGRGRAGSPGGAGDRRGGRPAGDARGLGTGGAGRHRHGPGRGRRPHRRGRGPGGGRRRRDPEPRRAAAGPGAARAGDRRRGYAAADRRVVRGRGSRPCPLRGFAQPVRAFRVLGPGRAEGRFEGLHAEALTPLVGREQELALLLDRWRQAKEGEGQVVLLSGRARHRQVARRPRLARAAPRRAVHDPALPLLALPHEQRAVAGDRPARARRRVPAARAFPRPSWTSSRRCWRQAVPDPGEAAPLLAALLSIPSQGRHPSAGARLRSRGRRGRSTPCSPSSRAWPAGSRC